MTVARREERGAQGVPSASLLRLNRNTLPNVLALGGAAADRRAIVLALHRASRLRELPFCAVDARTEQLVLHASLMRWLRHEEGPAPLACERGTLFMDEIQHLAHELQRLLLAYARRLEDLPPDARLGPGPARLAAGCRGDLAVHVLSGSFLAPLHDSLDKMCLDLRVERPGVHR